MFLIVKCRELNDQYECDCDREPLCLTSDPAGYGVDFEVYESDNAGNLTLVKDMWSEGF